MADMPTFVHVNDEGPKKGFLTETAPTPIERKLELIAAQSPAHIAQIQTVSFANLAYVPGAADKVRPVERKTSRPYSPTRWLNAADLKLAAT